MHTGVGGVHAQRQAVEAIAGARPPDALAVQHDGQARRQGLPEQPRHAGAARQVHVRAVLDQGEGQCAREAIFLIARKGAERGGAARPFLGGHRREPIQRPHLPGPRSRTHQLDGVVRLERVGQIVEVARMEQEKIGQLKAIAVLADDVKHEARLMSQLNAAPTVAQTDPGVAVEQHARRDGRARLRGKAAFQQEVGAQPIAQVFGAAQPETVRLHGARVDTR
ncbi:hypothetical protein D3C73_747280 [compost metagenome]